jgi:hypothetical protein
MVENNIGHVHWTLERFRNNYTATSNPIYVWSAWRLAKRALLPTPEWIEKAFAVWADNLIAQCTSPPKRDVAQAAGQAIGFDGGKNGENFFKEARRADRQERAMWLYFEACQTAKSPADAKLIVAEKIGVSEDTLERMLRRAWTESITDISPLTSVDDLLKPKSDGIPRA